MKKILLTCMFLFAVGAAVNMDAQTPVKKEVKENCCTKQQKCTSCKCLNTQDCKKEKCAEACKKSKTCVKSESCAAKCKTKCNQKKSGCKEKCPAKCVKCTK